MQGAALRCCLSARAGLPQAARSAAAAAAQAGQHRLPAAMCRAAASSSSGGAACGSDGSGGSGRQIAPPDVRELARMAHIEVTDAEVADWGPKIEGIVEWFGQLQEVDVEGVPPALRADVEGTSTLRPDEAVRYAEQASMLDQAAERDGPFVRVPKITTQADN